MDIFSNNKRMKEDSIKKALNYPAADITEPKLKAENEKET